MEILGVLESLESLSKFWVSSNPSNPSLWLPAVAGLWPWIWYL